MAWVKYENQFQLGYDGRRSTPVVYALYNQSQLIYIGHTQCVRSRLSAHRSEGKLTFDACKVRVTPGKSRRFKLEARLIVRLRPPMNKYVPFRYGRIGGR